MNGISANRLIESIKELIVRANTNLRPDILDALKRSLKTEANPNGKKALGMLIENAAIARAELKPICQDTGYVDVYFQWPKGLPLVPGLNTIADEAVKQAYTENNFRSSLVSDPLFNRKNTGDNTPANVYLMPSNEQKLTIKVFIKGAGSDNASAVFMLNPTASKEELVQVVISQVKAHGAKSCPPLVIGIGIGSTFDKAASLSKKALWRQIDKTNPDGKYAELEEEILGKANSLGIGPSALGGNTTALAVLIEPEPCHMATLPVALNLNCYALRTAETRMSLPI